MLEYDKPRKGALGRTFPAVAIGSSHEKLEMTALPRSFNRRCEGDNLR